MIRSDLSEIDLALKGLEGKRDAAADNVKDDKTPEGL